MVVRIIFPSILQSDMSRYGYLEVFQRVPWNSRTRVDCIHENRVICENKSSAQSSYRVWRIFYFYFKEPLSGIVKGLSQCSQAVGIKHKLLMVAAKNKFPSKLSVSMCLRKIYVKQASKFVLKTVVLPLAQRRALQIICGNFDILPSAIFPDFICLMYVVIILFHCKYSEWHVHHKKN